MRTLAATLAYDGTRYVGWQRQPDGVSIQGLLEAAIAAVEEQPVTVHGAGRTDAGVHAIGQVASFSLAHAIPCDALVRALNARLPPDVRVRAVDERSAGFHARFDAIAKTYRYVIAQGSVSDPFDHRFVWHVPHVLDAAAMAAALDALRGPHDFAAFQAAGTDVSDTVRTLHDVSCREVERTVSDDRPGVPSGRRLVISVRGDGFLRHMVRTIVGTLVEVGAGKRPVDDMTRLMAARDRRVAGPTAPAQGLCLVSVEYA